MAGSNYEGHESSSQQQWQPLGFSDDTLNSMDARL